jgi:hypothetical protein
MFYNAGEYVEKLSYVQAIHSQCRFCKLKMFSIFYDLCIFTLRTRLVFEFRREREAAMKGEGGGKYFIFVLFKDAVDY